RGALVGAAVVTFTLGLVWLWTPEQAEQGAAQVAPIEAPPSIRAEVEPPGAASIDSNPVEFVADAPAGSDPVESAAIAQAGNDLVESAETTAARLAAAVPDEPLGSIVSAPRTAEPPRDRAAQSAEEPPPLAVVAAVQPTGEGPMPSPARTMRSDLPSPAPARTLRSDLRSPAPARAMRSDLRSPAPARAMRSDVPSPAPARAQQPAASLPEALPAVDPLPIEPDRAPAASPPARSVASAPPPVRPPPAAKPTPRAARPEPAPKPAPARPRPPQVATIPPPPIVHVARTVWHPSPDRRSARVEVEGFAEPLELKEGDAVGVLVVAEIQPSAVVFLHGGARLRRAVGK
ncbi:MAG: hypothetical protein JRG95_13065, partial [Deltaproteobacteria bacterium]|nr:hypothetical protein [Deltaproteobacteria bacterium]